MYPTAIPATAITSATPVPPVTQSLPTEHAFLATPLALPATPMAHAPLVRHLSMLPLLDPMETVS